MHNSVISWLGLSFLSMFCAGAAVFLSGSVDIQAHATDRGLLKGCEDIPEAVELASYLKSRSQNIERYLQEVDHKKKELDHAANALTEKLGKIAAARNERFSRKPSSDGGENDSVVRLVNVYDQMKPDQAALILSNLPPDFAADILIRIQPEHSARIIAAVDPPYAAILTTYMGSRQIENH